MPTEMKTLRKMALRLAIGLLILWGMLIWYPVRTGFIRTTMLAVSAAFILSLVIALWRRKRLRWLPMMPPAIVLAFLFMPGRSVDPTHLRERYTQTLKSYDGTRYVWGGEGFRGVDCSGFLRAAMVDACLRESLRTLNPALARSALDLWWHDASAADMSDGFNDRTRRIGKAVALQEISVDDILPGDFAVTADGSHVMAYAGQGRWIAADPYAMKVIEFKDSPNWSIVKVNPCRWRLLDP